MIKLVDNGKEQFVVIEYDNRYAIEVNNLNVKIILDMFTNSDKNYYENKIDKLLQRKYIPLSWIKKKYIKDEEFVKEYYPEYLI